MSERQVIDCPHCTNGTIIEKGSMWWQDRHYCCNVCRGSGRVKPQSFVCRKEDVREDQA